MRFLSKLLLICARSAMSCKLEGERERLALALKEEALVEIPYRADDLDQLEQSLHETITRIQQQFAVLGPPSQTVCKSCDIRSLCRREHIIG
jgi:CRISPR/Cas system-associated exonuclease Cas4 (RecB family)